MNLCDLNCLDCCELKWLQRKFDEINKKIDDNQNIQDKINANIFKLLKESSASIENTFKNYYALNEEDYTKTLTSEDDINTLEPGTYKIVKTDMPQNAPMGIGIATYNGTLIKSQYYMAVFEETGFHYASAVVLDDNVIWTWYHYIGNTQINLLLYNYMKIRNYDKFNYSDVHDLTGFAAGVYTVDASVENIPVKTEGLLIVRQGVNMTDNYIVMFLPQNSNDIYKCYKSTDGNWSRWEQFAFRSNIPSLDGYATQDWVNQQIQDITGGNVTANWVKNNYYPLTNSQYRTISNNTDYNTLAVGCYFGRSANFTNTTISSIGGYILLVKFNANANNTRSIIYSITANQMYFCNSTASKIYRIAYITDIPSLSGYATQSWVQENFQPK